METGKVMIHGKEYLTVAYRVGEFRKDHPIKDGWGILTEITPGNEKILCRAWIENPEGKTIGVGWAEEVRSASKINKTSAVENCETSAIGRALSACGYAGTEYCSANELEGALKQQAEKKAITKAQIKNVEALTKAQIKNVEALIEKSGTDVEKFLEWAKVDKVENIPADRYKEIVAALAKKIMLADK